MLLKLRVLIFLAFTQIQAGRLYYNIVLTRTNNTYNVKIIANVLTDKERSSCKTAYNKDGNCLKLKDCEMVHEHILAGRLTLNQKDYLDKSQCNGIGDIDQICCAHRYQSIKVVSLWRDLLPQPPECGQNPPPYKTFDDTQTQRDEHPWSVLLIYRNVTANTKEPLCGGVLISNRYVLSSASCALKKGLRSVRLGEWNLKTNPDCFTIYQQKDCLPSFIEVSILEIHLNPRYSNYPDKDIALLRLRKHVDYKISIKPICLPLGKDLSDNQLVNKSVTAIGWGIRENVSNFSYLVKGKADMAVQSEVFCNNFYAELGRTGSKEQLCVSSKDGKDAPQSDTGGPLVYAKVDTKLNRVIHYIIGIRSCGSLDIGKLDGPGIYTRVGANIDWILALLKP